MKNKYSLVVILLLVLAPLMAFSQEESYPEDIKVDTLVQISDFINRNDSLIRWKKSRDFIYINYLDSLLRNQRNLRSDTSASVGRGQQKRNSFAAKMPGNSTVQAIFGALAILLVALIIYHVFFKNGLFRKNRRIRSLRDPEHDEQLLQEEDQYIELVKDAELRMEWNEAVRYLYLQTIRNLSNRELIFFSSEKTNHDYVEEMRGHKDHPEFEVLTRQYDYAWFGKFPLEANSYARIKQSFLAFNQKL